MFNAHNEEKQMIRSAMSIKPESDLDSIGQSKARTHKRGGRLTVVVENNKAAVVQGYKPGATIAQCLPTCIMVRDLSGHAKAVYGDFADI